MELDFKTIKALSSPTRIEILNEACRGEATPTRISNEVERSKSTVASHLEQLQDANLLERETEEGRRRVVYKPTSKTEAILNGRSRKVKFSLLSSVSTAWIGAALTASAITEIVKLESSRAYEKTPGQMGTMALDTGKQAAEKTAETQTLGSPENILLFAGLGFLSISIFGLLYGLLFSRLKEK